jgi:tetratricopeptide (TPR) repeat protein
MQGKTREAIDLHQRALKIDQELGDIEGQSRHLGNLGICHEALGEIPQAKEYLGRSLALYERIGIPATHPTAAMLQHTLENLRQG